MLLASASRPHPDPEVAKLARVAQDLRALEDRVKRFEETMRPSIDRVPPERRESARNLVHYLALRQVDLRSLQACLAELGLSSLGRSESCVLASLRQVSNRVEEALAARSADGDGPVRLGRTGGTVVTPPLSWEQARGILRANTQRILGPRPDGRLAHIMVTAPSAEEADRAWMAKMLNANMDVLRVNCAHEGPREWRRMLAALAAARRDTGKPCRVIMDLAGPKIRTGPVEGVRVTTWKVEKNEIGVVTKPARVRVHRTDMRASGGAEPALQIDRAVVARARKGDELRFRDARGRQRSLTVEQPEVDGALLCTAVRRAYVLDATRARLWRRGRALVTALFSVSSEGTGVDVRQGDELLLTGRRRTGRPPRRAADGRVERRGAIACTPADALTHLEVGHRVLFDDGKIESVVQKVVARAGGTERDFVLRITRTQKPIVKLRAEKGINLPDTRLDLPALTDEDRKALAFVATHADGVSISFVRDPEDVRQLHEALDELGRPELGVVLKIETRAGFEALPRLLLEGLRRPGLAVMIARGDLAVEVGFERLAELQEEILWLCEACQVPTIWATQVLDTLARTGTPSRAEVTDAAAAVGAECVMLNKGPYVDEAVKVLCDILRRMEGHHDKKRSLYRRLKVSRFLER